MNANKQLANPKQIKLLTTTIRIIILSITAVILVHVLFCLFSYNSLPSFFPTHFAGQQVGSFVKKSIASWFLLFFINTLVTVSVGSLSLLIFKIPIKYLNVPSKKQFLLLSKQAQHRILTKIVFHSLILTLTSAIALFTVHIIIYLITIHAISHFSQWLLLLVGIIFIIEIIFMIVIISCNIQDETQSKTQNK